MPRITIDLTDRQAAGIKYVMDQRNAEIAEQNEAIRARNAALPAGGEAEAEIPLYTPQTYVQFVMTTAADGYVINADQAAIESRAEKIARLDAAKLAEVDAILA